jgi:DNA modification methylase
VTHKKMKLLLGDCLDKLKELEDNSVDSIVTDPPYGLAFMGKTWDYDVPSQEIWEECMRVLKPGGHLLAFAGSRTYHRMAVRIEDAGFEIRDQIMWVYGSGFPKSHNIGKAVDEKLGNKREVISTVEEGTGPLKTGHVNKGGGGGLSVGTERSPEYNITKGNSEWEGWGTALKPAHEPIVMARKPLSENTVVDNVLEWGTGGINIDESRIPFKDEADRKESTQKNQHADFGTKPLTGNIIYGDYSMVEPKNYNPPGRFPANIIFDEEAGKILDEQSGNRPGCTSPSDAVGSDSIFRPNQGGYQKQGPIYGDSGGASRFFYCPKTSKKDRNEGLEHLPISRPDERTETGMGSFVDKGIQPQQNIHPTVKPTDLMLYLIRLVTPKGGTTLDPFMGSGSTGKGAVRGGFDFIGIEREKEYFQIAEARIDYEQKNPYIEQTGERVQVNENSHKFF